MKHVEREEKVFRLNWSEDKKTSELGQVGERVLVLV